MNSEPALSIEEHWPEIRRVVSHGLASTIYCSLASINHDGTPNVTPVGTVFLREDKTGYYFDHYTRALARNLDANPNICVMAVNASFLFWFRSLLLGRFNSPPGVRLYGVASLRRNATEEEIRKIERRVRPTRLEIEDRKVTVYTLPSYHDQRVVKISPPDGFSSATSMWRKDDPYPKVERSEEELDW